MFILNLLVSFLVFFTSILLAFIYSNNNRSGYISFASWFFVSVGMVYGLGAVFVFNYLHDGGEFNNAYVVKAFSHYWWVHGFLSLVLVFSFIFGWRLPVRNKGLYKSLANKTYNLKDSQVFRFAIFVMVLSFCLRYLYVDVYGGFFEYLEYNRKIRSGVFEVRNPYSFLQPFGVLSFFATYMFFSLMMRKYKLVVVSFLFLISLLFSIYVSYSYAGRVSFLIFLGVFALTISYGRNIRLNLLLMIVVFAIPFSFPVIYFISNFFEIKGGEYLSYFIIKEIGHLFSSFFMQIDKGYLYRGFVDFLMSPLYLLPSSWTSGLYEDASQANTKLLLGNVKGEGGVTGGIPVDILTLGVMQLNVAGVVFTGALFGWLLKRLDYFISLIENKEFRYIFAAYVSLRVAFIGTLYAHPPHLMSGLFVLIVLFFMFHFFNLLRRVKK